MRFRDLLLIAYNDYRYNQQTYKNKREYDNEGCFLITVWYY